MPIEIRRKDVKTLVAQSRVQLVDVRPASEYTKEHLPHALSLPLDDITAASVKSLHKDMPVIVYSGDCQCDVSARAAWRLEGMGFQEVYRYTGGKADWLAAGWDVEGEEARKPRIRQMIQTEVLTCSIRERLQDVNNRRRQNHDIAVVVNDRNIVLGVIQGDAWDRNENARVIDVMQPGPQTIRPHLESKQAQAILRGYTAPSVIVTTSDGELLGILRIAQKNDDKARCHIPISQPA